MPLTPAGLTGALIVGLRGVAMTGSGVPKLAQGVANGVCAWVKSLKVVTVDAGTLGVGVGFLPFAVPPPLLIASLLAAYPVNGQLGVMAPQEATGLGVGLGLGFIQGIMTTQHPTVGSGTGVAKVIGGPAFPFLMAGFAGVDIKGTGATQKASAISLALQMTLAVFTLPIPIVGAPTPMGSSGVGQGSIL